MTTDIDDGIRGERALGEGEIDRLGFAEVANRIARSIVDRASAEGLVIGLDGPWGSGKSSLLHLIEHSLAHLPKDDRPTVIKFRPWLVGQRDALLANLFSDLAQAISSVQLTRGDATSDTIIKAKRTAEAMRRFAYSLSKAGDVVELAGEAWGPLKLIGKGMNGLAKLAGKKKADPDLVKLKSELVDDLRALNHRFLVTIDDVDRLEPGEVIEVLRLVRSVADFPNIVYVLCYDADRLAESIENATRLEDGLAYLEKIIQLTVMVPKPEPFELRHWFGEELAQISGPVSSEVAERPKTVIDQEGGVQLKTPRAVVRTLDSLRFLLPALRDEQIDIADLVWLTLIKDGAPSLYRWIEGYSANVAATSFGTASMSESGRATRLKELIKAVDAEQLSDVMYRHMFSDQLPGVEASYGGDGDPIALFQKVDTSTRQKAIEGKRLASPDHYRLYFSLIGPSHAISQAGFDQFWMAATSSPDEVAAVLVSLHGQSAQGSLRKSDVLFERLRAMDEAQWTPQQAQNLLLAFGRVMDDAFRIQPEEQSFIVSSWDRVERLLPRLFSKHTGGSSDALIEELFYRSPALGWVTSILRHETFAHGRFGDQRRPDSEWALSDAQYDRAAEIMLSRYRSMSLRDILAAPRPAHIFYAWNQAGDEDGPRNLIAQSTLSDDEAFVDVLGVLTTAITSSNRGRYTSLKSENVKHFLDYDSCLERLSILATNGSPYVRGKAQSLLGAASADNDW
jgi:predicted KAP-like P-loop ATPase